MPVHPLYDVIIIGGGPAGMSAAIVLGRCRRKIILFDSQTQRNKASQGIHNYLTRDDILPADFIQISLKELEKYKVPSKNLVIRSAKKIRDGNFELTDVNGKRYRSRKLLVATGLKDVMPRVRGFEKYYGKSIFHCPYCDAWECRDQLVGVLSENRSGIELAISLRTWTDHVLLFTNGKKYLRTRDKRVLKSYQIAVQHKRIDRLEGKDGRLQQVLLKDGSIVQCGYLFYTNVYEQQSRIAEKLGCRLSKQGVIVTSKSGRTSVPGLYVAGDASWDIHLVIIAAAEGAKAGVYINKQLQKEEKNARMNLKTMKQAR